MLLRVARVVAVTALLAAVAVPACGSTSDSKPTGSGGSGGDGTGGAGAGNTDRGGKGGAAAGGTSGNFTPESVPCGSTACIGVVIPQAQNFAIPGCCADPATSTCGLDSTFLAMFGPTFQDPCQPLAQAGVLDMICPSSPKAVVQGTALTISFPGCCRSNGLCGYDLDTIGGIISIGLGCVDSEPFLDGGRPMACAGGAAGQGGGGGESSTGASGAAGERATGGMAGE
jgi:hypothetical protein